MHACSFHLDPHMKSVETKMFWCIKNQLKIGDICWRCNCTCQIELIRLSNRLHYNFKFIKYSWLIKKVVRLQVCMLKKKNKKKNSAPTTLSCVCGLSLSLFFFKVCKYGTFFPEFSIPLAWFFCYFDRIFSGVNFFNPSENLYRNCGIGGLSNKITGVFMLKWREKVWIYFEYNKNWIIYVCVWNIIGKRADTPQSFIFWC